MKIVKDNTNRKPFRYIARTPEEAKADPETSPTIIAFECLHQAMPDDPAVTHILSVIRERDKEREEIDQMYFDRKAQHAKARRIIG
jgi:hypothetical protein